MPVEGPLSATELAELEATLLPALERHHLRLMAHGLRTLQAIASESGAGPALPERPMLARWALQQEAVGGDQEFAAALADQLLATAGQLEAIGQSCGKGALALELGDLIAWATAAANQRLAIIPGSNDPP